MAYRTVGKGDRISEYILLEKLGVGGFGEVWKAEHSQIPGKYVAIKVPTSPDSMDLLKKEAVFQHQLDHPNIVKTIGLNTQHDPPYFIMEFVEGKNLRQRMLEDGILPPPYAIDIAVQVLEALAYAHSKNIIHKDIKPENILVEKRKINVADKGKALLHYVKITDLGLGMLPGRSDDSMVVSEFARTSGMRLLSGTLFYMAPEQMVPGRSVDHRADIYSMGVVLYEMLTGELPLGMDLPSELNPVVTPELDAICKRALSIDRDMRYQAVQEMAVDLQRAKESFLLRLVASGAPSVEVGPEPKRLTPRSVPLPSAAVIPGRRRFRVSRFAEWALLVVVTGLLGISLLTFVHLYRTSRDKKSAPLVKESPRPITLGGPLRITSEPSGVEVSIDGKLAGKTPFELASPHHVRTEVRLSHPFYHDRVLLLEPRNSGNRRLFSVVDVKAGREQALLDATEGLTLERLRLEARKGGLKIQTPNVEGVVVRIDGGLFGTTPFSSELDANYYTVRLEKQGFEPFEAKILVDPNSTCTMVVPMVPAGTQNPQTGYVGRVSFDSDPPGAAIFINNEERGVTPSSVDLPHGEYDFRLSMKYFEPHKQKMLVSAPTSTYSVTLRRVRAQVAIDSEPRGASVVLDGRKLGKTPVTLDNVEGGAHEAVLQLDGYYDAKRPIEIVDSGIVSPIVVPLQKVPPGLLTIESVIPGVEVYIDNAAAGKAPLKSRVLSGGQHRVRLLGVERVVVIEPAKELTARFSADDLRMVHVSAGDFGYGSREPSPGLISWRKETLPAYFIDKYEVTNAQYGVFLAYLKETSDHSKCHPDEGKGKDHTPACWEDENLNGGQYPVVGVDFWDAYAYASWAGKRLPTEKEWEKAARGRNSYTYPWGDQWDPTRLNWGDFTKPNYEFTSPVGAFPTGASPYGCMDMAGNATEWCADTYEEKRPDRVVRGGSFRDREFTMNYIRWKEAMNTRAKWLGFRCVLDDPK